MIGEHVVFDIIAWLSALVLAWLMYRWRFRSSLEVLTERIGAGYFLSLSIGGLAGAFVFGTLNGWVSGEPGIGRSIIGGLVGAIGLIEIYKFRRGIRGSTGAVFAVPFAFAIAIGRMGCYLSGLEDFTYGSPTALPWGVDFGDGVLRHPVQLYESIAMGITGALLLLGFARRKAWLLSNGFYVVAAIYGLQRFAWEFLKPYATVIGPFNLFHILCSILVLYALVMILVGRSETA